MTLDPSAVGALTGLSWRGWVTHRGLARSGVRRGEIDHVLVGPGGVFVVSRLRWPGPVEVAGGQLLLQGSPSTREVDELAADAADVLAIVPDVPVHAVLCLERHQAVSGWVRNVMICTTSTVDQVLTSRPPVLSPERVQEIGHILAAHLRRRPPSAHGAVAAGAPLSRSMRALVQAATLAVAALMVIGMFQTGVVGQVSAAMSDLVSEASDPEQPRGRTGAEPPLTPRQDPDPSQRVEEGHRIEVKGKQCRVEKKHDRCRDRERDRDRPNPTGRQAGDADRPRRP